MRACRPRSASCSRSSRPSRSTGPIRKSTTRLPGCRRSRSAGRCASFSLLLGDRAWLTGFATESAGWLVYLAALRLAPISLVQAVCASGIAVLAFLTARGRPARLARHEQAAVVVALAGLVLLSLSLVGTHQPDHAPASAPVVVWLASSLGGALLLAVPRLGLARGPALGLAAGLLFAGGDISAKLVTYGGMWLVAVLSLIVCYASGTTILQAGFQHGDALTAAGLATLATNGVPIAAGFVVFGEELPHGTNGTLQIAAFASARRQRRVPHARDENSRTTRSLADALTPASPDRPGRRAAKITFRRLFDVNRSSASASTGMGVDA